jgi:transposase
MDFFRAWVNARQQKEYIAYDVTSLSSYSRGSSMAEYGYNRDHESLPQVNYGMYYGEESKLPIFYCVYKGSIVDKSELPHMMQYNDVLGIKEVCFVLDRGFFTEDNIRSLAHQHRYIIGMRNGLNASKEIIKKYGAKVGSSKYDIGDTETTGIAIEDDRYGFRSKIMLYHSYGKRLGEAQIFKSKLKKWEQDILYGKIPKAAEEYFGVSKTGKGDVKSVARNHEAIDEHLHNTGYFLMMTTDLKKTPADVLDIYRMKDVIETCFDDLKNGIDMKRLRVHSDEAMEGKAFVAFIALILRSYVHNRLKDYMSQQSLSLAQIFDELRMIKAVKIRDGMLLSNPITKKQRTILSYFGKEDQDIQKELKKYDKKSDYWFS